MRIWKKTDIGVVRKENQDACATRSVGPYLLAAVCDGMGGAKAGEIASAMTIQTFMDALEDHLKADMTIEEISNVGIASALLANDIVYHRAKEDENCRGMGTTLVATVVRGNQVVVFNIGDSRLYHINASGIHCITKDHSLVQDMLDRGDITVEEARTHPNRNLITRALGTEKTVMCDTFFLTLEESDSLLLCSDGLINTVSDQEMLYEVVHDENMETCLDRMLEIAIDRGAPDNVTMVLMKYVKEAEA